MENPSSRQNSLNNDSAINAANDSASTEIPKFATTSKQSDQNREASADFNAYRPTLFDEISPIASLRYSLDKSIRTVGNKVKTTLKGEDFHKMSKYHRQAVRANETIREMAQRFDRLVDKVQVIKTEVTLLQNKCSSFEIEYSLAFEVCRIIDRHNKAQWSEHRLSSALRHLPEHIHMPGQMAWYLVSDEDERLRQMKNAVEVFHKSDQYRCYQNDQESIAALENQRNELIGPLKAFSEATRVSGIHLKTRWQDRLGLESKEPIIPPADSSLTDNSNDHQRQTLTTVNIPYLSDLPLKDAMIFNVSQWQKTLKRQVGSKVRGEDFHASSPEQRAVIARNPQLNEMITDFDDMVSEVGLLESRICQLEKLTDRFEVAFSDLLNARRFIEKNRQERLPEAQLEEALHRLPEAIQVPWQDQPAQLGSGHEARHDVVEDLVDTLYSSDAWQAYQADRVEVNELSDRRRAIVEPLRAFSDATCSTGIHLNTWHKSEQQS